MARPNVSVSADENFRSRCTQEKKAFDEWPVKWGWILEECNIRNQKLEAIKKKAVMRKGIVETDTRTVLPFPTTTQKEIGWLSSKEEFQLEIYGGYITKLPVEKPQ